MSGRLEWVLLAYRLPREPSTPRIALWRRLRRLGVVQVLDGLVALPADARTREQLEWLADEVLEADGEASVWMGAARLGGSGANVGRTDVGCGGRRVPADHRRCPTGRRTTLRPREDARWRDFAVSFAGSRHGTIFPPAEAEQARAAVGALGALEQVAP